MLLRGTTVDMKPCVFTIEDIPVRITKENVALIGKNNTPLIIADTIVRGPDDGSFFEGDLVLDKSLNFVGTIVYKKGFKLFDAITKETTDLPDMKDVWIESNLRVNMTSLKEIEVEPVIWVYNEQKIEIRHIITGGDGKIVTTANINRKVSTKNFKLYSGIRLGSNLLCFGDTHNAGIVELHNNKPMVRKLNGEYVEIEEE